MGKGEIYRVIRQKKRWKERQYGKFKQYRHKTNQSTDNPMLRLEEQDEDVLEEELQHENLSVISDSSVSTFRKDQQLYSITEIHNFLM